MEEPTKPFFQYNYIEMCNTGSAGNEKENWVSGSRDKTTTIAEGEFNYSRMEPEIEPGDQLLLFPDDIHAHVSQYRHTLTQPRKAIWSDIDSYSVLWPYTFPLLQDSLCISKHSLFSGLWSLLWLDNNSGTRMRPKPGFFYAYIWRTWFKICRYQTCLLFRSNNAVVWGSPKWQMGQTWAINKDIIQGNTNKDCCICIAQRCGALAAVRVSGVKSWWSLKSQWKAAIFP